MKPQLALKIDVDTLRGTAQGVPRLLRLFAETRAQATFLFSVGRDHTGRAIRRLFRPGFFAKVSRTSVLEHYGLRTLLYGTLLPGPHIAHACAREMRSVAADGQETGLHVYDHVKWQDFAAARDAGWTEREMKSGIEAFREVFGVPPKVHGAAGWQMNAAAYRLEAELGFEYASDVRGTAPFVPVIDGLPMRCPQLPTTLPTLDELIGTDGMDANEAADRLLALTRETRPGRHVYTLHAELEGMRLEPVMRKLLRGWVEQGYELVSLGTLFAGLDRARLPHHAVSMAMLPGRSGALAVQGAAVTL